VSEILQADLLIAVIDQRVGTGCNADNDRVSLRTERKSGEWEIYTNSRMEQKSGTDEEEQRQQETDINQWDEEDQKRIQLD